MTSTLRQQAKAHRQRGARRAAVIPAQPTRQDALPLSTATAETLTGQRLRTLLAEVSDLKQAERDAAIPAEEIEQRRAAAWDAIGHAATEGKRK